MRRRIEAAFKEAMKARDKRRVGTLRLMRAAIKDRDIALRGEGDAEGISDEAIIALLVKMISQREESIRDYRVAGRLDLVKQEEEEREIIRGFLPEPLSDEAMEAVCLKALEETGARSLKDMGVVMSALRVEFAGRIDFGKAGRFLRGRLSQ